MVHYVYVWQTRNMHMCIPTLLSKVKPMQKFFHLTKLRHINRLLSKDGTSLQHKGHAVINDMKRSQNFFTWQDLLRGCCQTMRHLYSTRDI